MRYGVAAKIGVPQVYRHLLHNTLMKDEDEFAVRFFFFSPLSLAIHLELPSGHRDVS